MIPRSLAGFACASILLASSALATTYTVDINGGGNFTDIQTAIWACNPGDVLLVQPGTYAPFALDRGITIIGYGACSISGTLSIAGVQAGETASVVRIETNDLDIQGCNGHVIVQDLSQPRVINVLNSPDVRFARIAMPVHDSSAPVTGLTLSGSRLELANCTIRGEDGSSCVNPIGLDGARGLDSSNSRLHATRSALFGGVGSHCDQQDYYCGWGQNALRLQLASQAILCGRSADLVQGGYGPVNLFYNDCSHDGGAFCAVEVEGASDLRHSGLSIHGMPYSYGTNCIPFAACDIGNPSGTVTQPAPADPTLTVSGNPAAGSSVLFTIDGPPGATAVLSFGRGAIVQVDPNTVIEKLTQSLRNVNLGAIPSSGSATFTWPISSVLQPGVKLFAQAAVTLPGGEVRRTNSVPVILR